MRYIICEKPGVFTIKDKSAPIRKPGEVLLKINQVGICGTDIHAYAGRQAYFTYPRILGHELAATVVESGDESAFKSGEKVLILPYQACGSCFACTKGLTNCCVNLKVFGVHKDGGMQELIIVPEDMLIPAGDLSYDEMAIVEPLAIGAHAIKRAQLQPGETVVVIGCGPIGIGIMKFAKLAGSEVIAIDVNPDRVAYVTEEIDVDYGISSDAVSEIKRITHENMASAVFDATGNKAALEFGVNYMSHGGRYVLVGLSKSDLIFNHPSIHAKEASILCSRNATEDDFRFVVKTLKAGQFPHQFLYHPQVSFS